MKALRMVWPYLVLALLAAVAVAILFFPSVLPPPPSWDFTPPDHPAASSGAIQSLCADRPSSEGVSGLVKLLADLDPEVRQSALLGLLNAGPDRIQALPALVALLRESDLSPEGDAVGVHPLAAYLLGKMGPPARSALPELTRILGEPNSLARHEAAVALWRISSDPELIVPELTRMLRSRDVRVQSTAVAVLRRIGREMALPRFQEETRADADRSRPAWTPVALDFATEVATYLEQLEAWSGVVALRGDTGLPPDGAGDDARSESWPIPDR